MSEDELEIVILGKYIKQFDSPERTTPTSARVN